MTPNQLWHYLRKVRQENAILRKETAAKKRRELHQDQRTTEEFGNMMSLIQKERYERMSEEEKKKLTRKANEAVRGSTLSVERKVKLSESKKKWYEDHPEAKVALSNRRRGCKHSDSSKLQMGQKRRALSEVQAETCRKLYSEGIPMARIGEQFGIGTHAIFNAIHRKGVYGKVG
jgi:hypothetical protein